MKILIVFFMIVSSSVYAGVCEIHYNRTACSGQEVASYKKCDGTKECTKKESAKDLADCQKKARKACANSRVTETKSKIITAKFDGAAVTSTEGDADFCLKYENRDKEFDICK